MIMISKERILEQLRDAVIKLDIDSIQDLCEMAIKAGVPAYKAVIEGMAVGMEVVGQKYDEGEYYLAELIVAGETMKEGMEVLGPHLKSSELSSAGKCVIGTVKGDLHDIGKNVFVSLLKAQNYDVIDLGVDVSPEQFVRAIEEHSPNILAMSALLTTTMGEMEKVIKEVEKQGHRNNLKIIIGGAPMTNDYALKIGADAAATDAIEGLRIIGDLFPTD
jgi:5-methyltetrahydrofolate--homocysteine methyltransferase